MASIGGLNIDLAGLGSGLTNMLYTGGIILVAFAIVCGIGYWIFMFYWNKSIYRYPVTITNIRENGTSKDINNIKGGIVKGKAGVRDFKMKIPKKWKKVKLGYVPDLSLADADSRIHFIQIGDGTLYQQTKKTIVTEKSKVIPITSTEANQMTEYFQKEIEEQYGNYTLEQKEKIFDASWNNWLKQRQLQTETISMLVEPIPTDVKTVTINSIHDVDALTDKNKITAMVVGFIAFVIMAIVQIIFLYFTRNR